MLITLVRFIHPGWTDGFQLIDGQWFGYTLERPKFHDGKENVPNLCCIPKGEYKVVVTPSALFGRKMPLILDVPGGRRGVRFHGGNIVKDSRGCILTASRKLKPGQIQGSLEATLTHRIELEGAATLRILEAT